MINGRSTLYLSPPHAVFDFDERERVEMENSKSDELELLKTLVEQINNPSGCVLFLARGSRFARTTPIGSRSTKFWLANCSRACMKLPRFPELAPCGGTLLSSQRQQDFTRARGPGFLRARDQLDNRFLS